MVVDAGKALNLSYKIRPDGTYCFVSGPCYESKAECRFLRSFGGDSVGMSTVPEVIAAKHCGMKILGLSLITNKVVIGKEQSVAASHAEVLEAVNASGMHVEAIVRHIISKEVMGPFLAEQPAFVYKPAPASAHGHAAAPTPAAGGCCPAKGACCPVSGACKDTSSSGCCAKKCCLTSDCCTTTLTLLALGSVVAGLYIVMKHHNK
jgi:hypothetical protein